MLNIAHRGFSARYPENTCLAYERALQLGVAWFELDLRLTRDGHLVVVHDATVDRTTNGSGSVAELTLSEVRALDAGVWRGADFAGERVPTFEEVLARFGRRAGIVVELKFDGTDGILLVIDAVRRHRCEGAIVMSSFNFEHLPAVRTLWPGVPLTALLRIGEEPLDEAIARVRASGADTIGPQGKEVTEDLVQKAREAGLRVRTWGLGDDRGPLMRRLIGLGADGTTTDHPDVLQAILSEARQFTAGR